MKSEAGHAITVEPIWIVAFTGHRPKPTESGRSIEEIASCRETLLSTLQSLQQKASEHGGHFELLCSAADGADLLAIDVAESIGMPVHLNLPLPLEEFKNDYFDETNNPIPSWKKAEQYIAKSQDPSSDWTYRVALGDGVRTGCYHDTNLQMLEAADVLIAIYNGIESNATGGTAEVIELADEEHLRIPTIVLDSSQNGEVVRHDNWEVIGPDEQLLQKINADLASPEAQKSSQVSQRTSSAAVWAVHEALDNVANNSGQAFRGSLLLSTKLHFAATVIATITASFTKVLLWKNVPVFLTTTELILVGYAFGLFIYFAKKKANPRWRRSRLAAEISDSQIQTAGLVDPLQPLVVRHDENWKRFALTISLDAHRQKELLLKDVDSEQRRIDLTNQYLENRIGGQLDYFRTQTEKSSKTLHRWHLIAKVTTYLATPVVLLALIMKAGFLPKELVNDWIKSVFIYALPILVPLVAGFAATMIVVGDAARRATRYKQVVQRLEKYAQLVPSLATPSATQRVILEVEDILLDEMIEWHATAGNMGH